jgi:flavin reductase (DIM6/NTAB) family NADH-FMN oxidoreductase RutF
MAKKSFSLSKVYTLIEPGPVVMVTTARKGRPNIMTLAWHTMIDFTPPLVGCVMSNRNYSFDALKTTGECVINIPAAALAKKAVACGNTSGRDLDKFKAFHLTPVKASRVKAPMIDECFANLECKVVDDRMAARYNFFILEVVRAWIDPSQKNPRTIHHQGKGVFMIGGKTIKLPSKMK